LSRLGHDARERSAGPRTTASQDRDRITVSGIDLMPQSLESAAIAIRGLAESHKGHSVHLCNSYTLSLSRKDKELASGLSKASMCIPDGVPVAWLCAARGWRQVRALRGPDLFRKVLEDGANWDARHMLYGTDTDTLNVLSAQIAREYPKAKIVHAEAPTFGPLDALNREHFKTLVAQHEANVVWIALGTPKQDLFVDEMAMSVPSVLIAIGAAFDFVSGSKAEAPVWLHGSGFEWIFRLTSEPRRLWRRYLQSGSWFFTELCGQSMTISRAEREYHR
jgi:N-acetylglucosaminyldiphosphoundecaprenol N-acetyl-beta-D-mannosaminyltransferase